MQFNWFVCDQKANIACIKTLNDFWLFVTFALLFCNVAVVVPIILNVHNLSHAQQNNQGLRLPELILGIWLDPSYRVVFFTGLP